MDIVYTKKLVNRKLKKFKNPTPQMKEVGFFRNSLLLSLIIINNTLENELFLK